jgi:hypothetical protein
VGVGEAAGAAVGAASDLAGVAAGVGGAGDSVTTADGELTGCCDSAADGRAGNDGRLNEPDGTTTPLQAANSTTTTRPTSVGRTTRRGPDPFVTGSTGMTTP